MPSTPARLRNRPVAIAAVLVVLATVLTVWWTHRPGGTEKLPMVIPADYSAPRWERMLAGDTALSEDTYTTLSGYHPGLSASQAQKVADVAAPVLAADLTSLGRQGWPDYWPPAATTTTPVRQRCTQVHVKAVSAAVLPTVDKQARTWVKALVPYTGTCGETTYTDAAPGVEYVYLLADPKGYEPVREWDIPQDSAPATAEGLQDWQLAPLDVCPSGDNTPQRLRTFAAEAYNKMCADAKADGVVLVTDASYRTRSQQAKLFNRAVDHYGSVAEAQKWVAYADGEHCSSKHCTATAVNVEPDSAALRWLWQVVGCSSGTTTTKATECAPGATPVRRAQTYGFVLPYERIPGYMEFVLPVDDGQDIAADCRPDGVGVDVMVAAVFRCRLERAQVPPAQVAQAVSEALVVSKCTSEWNPSAVVYAGRYATEPNPADGRIYSETGVFGLRRELVDAGWVPGQVTNPVDNINAAASLWLATRGWEQFPCATGTDPGLKVGPVLPSYGGPAIPDWATRY